MTGKLKPLLVASLLLWSLCAFAQTEAQQTRRAQLEREIAILDRQIKDNAAQSASVLTRLSLVQSRMSARQALVRESDREISALTSHINKRQKEIDKQQAALDTMTVYYGRLVKNAYKNRDARIWYMYILASDNLGQATRRFGYLRDLSSQMNTQAAKIQATKADLEVQKDSLLLLRGEAQKLRQERVRSLDSLRREEQQVKTLTSTLNKQKTKYQRELNDKKKQAEALEKEIKKAIAAAMAASTKPASGANASTTRKAPEIDYTLAGEFVANKGKLPWPAQGSIVARFGKQYHSVFKSLKLPDNNGVTIAVAPDAQVTAVFDGTVNQIRIFPGYHQCILVQHGNYFTLYSKMKEVYVKAGDKVKTGQVLGTVDTISGETVFHFEIWNEKTVPQNPEVWLRPR